MQDPSSIIEIPQRGPLSTNHALLTADSTLKDSSIRFIPLGRSTNDFASELCVRVPLDSVLSRAQYRPFNILRYLLEQTLDGPSS